MPDYLAKIRAKGLDATGVTEELAKSLYHQLGSHHLLVVEARVERRTENGDGSHTVDLVLTQVEPSTASFVDDHLRELMRGMYRNRQIVDGAIPELADGPDLRDVVKGSGEAVLQRDADGSVDRLWDGNTGDGDSEHRPGCVFPGCRRGYEHGGDHDPFGPSVEDPPADGGVPEGRALLDSAEPEPVAPVKLAAVKATRTRKRAGG